MGGMQEAGGALGFGEVGEDLRLVDAVLNLRKSRRDSR
jgi:hypothetical protein